MPQILHYFFIFSIPWNKELFLGCVKKNYVVRVTWDRFPVDLLYTESDHRIRQNPQKPLWHHQLVWNIFPKHPKKYLKSLLYSVVHYGGWRGELLIIQKVNKLDYIGAHRQKMRVQFFLTWTFLLLTASAPLLYSTTLLHIQVVISVFPWRMHA